MNPTDPAGAQQIVTAFAELLERDARADTYPAPIETLPYAKETIKTAIRTSVTTLRSMNQLTDELRDFLEVAYVSLADYVERDLVQLLGDYHRASADLQIDARMAREKIGSGPWQVLSDTSRLAGEIAKTIADEADTLRREFETFSKEAKSG